MFVNDHQTDWDKHIPLLLMAYRTAEHQTTKLTPSRMMFRREIKLPIDLWAGRPQDSRMAEDGPTYVQQLQDQLDEIHVFASEKITISSHAMKKYYDVKALGMNYEVGTSVWLHNPQRRKGKSPKLSRNWDGPYVVTDPVNEIVVRIRKSPQAKPKVVHVNRLKPYNGDDSFNWLVHSKNPDAGIHRRNEASRPAVKPTASKSLQRSERTTKLPLRYSSILW